MPRFMQVTVILMLLVLPGCAQQGPYQPSDEHCSVWYLMGLEPSPERLKLQSDCLKGYYTPQPQPT
jgi:hypothetical protein